MDNYLKDLDTQAFGHALHQILMQYGFGVLSKSDLEAALYHALCQASDTLETADSYQRAEILRLTDARFRAIHRRAVMWLNVSAFESDTVMLNTFLQKALDAYAKVPDDNEVKILIDDDIERRNIQPALERDASNFQGIAVELSLTGRALVLRGFELDSLID